MRSLLSVAGGALLAGAASGVFAQTAGTSPVYPARPIRIIVPFVPAGPTDINARMVAQRLTEAWGQSVIVDNRPGAGGMLGTEIVAKAPPDGYTLLGANPGPLTIAPSLQPKLPYDVQRHFAPVILVTHTNSVFVSHPGVPAKTIKELIALARARPEQLTYGSPGIGTVGHLTFELLSHMAGIRLTHVPYKGTQQGLTDLLAGQIDLRTLSIPIAVPMIKSGKVRVLGNNGLRRSPLMPDVPTLDESGLKGFESSNWNGIMAPAGTPREIIMRLHDEIARRVLGPAQRERLIREGYNIAALGPEEFAAYVKADTAKWAKVIKAAKLKPE